MKNKITKIGQTNNFNSYTDLYIVNNEVYKIYKENNDLVKYNIENVKNLLKKKNLLKRIPQLVLPNSLLVDGDEIVGFSMPYIKGVNLYEFIDNNEPFQVYTVLKEIYDLMGELNSLSINVCDFHQDNVIIDFENKIHLIDCDSFIINGNNYETEDFSYNGKYIEQGRMDIPGFSFYRHNVRSDYFCLFMTLLNYIDEDKVYNLYHGYIKTNNENINKLVETKNIDLFWLNSNDLFSIAKDLKNISFEDKNYISYDEIEKGIKRVKQML